jgi:hypothetical protein
MGVRWEPNGRGSSDEYFCESHDDRQRCTPDPRRQRHAGALWAQRWQHAQASLSGAAVVIRLRTSGGAKGDDVPPEGPRTNLTSNRCRANSA